MRKGSSFYFGLIIILVGVILLLSQFDIIDIGWHNFWVLIIWVIGLSFELGFFFSKERKAELLVPGGILLTIALIFTLCILFGWHLMADLWPLFILAPAVGILQLYLFGVRKTELLIPVGILGIVGGIFLVRNLLSYAFNSYIIPVALIIFGLLLILPKKDAK